MAGQTVIVSVLADTKRFDAGLNKASSSLKRFNSSLSRFSGTVTIALGLAATAFGRFVQSSVLSAAELEQLLGGAEVVYGDFFGNIEKFSADAYKRMGLAQNDYLRASTVLGVLLQDTSIKGEKLTSTVDALALSASDLASLVGGTTEEALLAFQSAIKGNFQILDNFGIKLTAAEVSARALKDTGKKSVSQLTEQEKVLARVNLLLEKSSFATGNFAKESGTFAGSLAILTARLKNFLNDVGGPIVAKLESQNVFGKLTTEINKFVASPAFDSFVNELSNALVELAKATPKIAKGLADAFIWMTKPENAKRLGEVLAAIIALPPALNAINATLGTLRTLGVIVTTIGGGAFAFGKVTGEVVALTKFLNTFLSKFPKGKTTLSRFKLVLNEVAFSMDELAKKFATTDTRLARSYGFFSSLASKLEQLVGSLSKVNFGWAGLGKELAKLGGPIAKFLGLVKGFSFLTIIIPTVIGLFKGIGDGINDAFAGKNETINLILEPLRFLKDLLGTVGDAIANFVANSKPLKNIWESITGLFAQLPKIADGIWNAFEQIGRAIGRFIIDPLKQVKKLWEQITLFQNTNPASGLSNVDRFNSSKTPTLTRVPSSAPAVAPITVNVNALTPTPEVGRVVVNAIKDYQRTGGR